MSNDANAPPEPYWSSIYSDELDAAAARDEWRGILAEMERASTLSRANGPTIERLVRFRIEFARAARDVAERGTIVKAKRSGVPAVNPS